MGYLERWDVWLAIIIVILILMCVWVRLVGSDDESETDSCFDTMTRRVEEVPTTADTVETLTCNEIAIVQEPRQLPRQSAGERRCQEVLESIYQREFLTQVRMDELKNPDTGRNLELDIYCPELRLACEYDGAQHRKVVKKFHPNGQADLDAQKRRDSLKDELCERAGIFLIRVPDTTPLSQIEDYIRYRLPESVEARQQQQLVLRNRSQC